MCGIAGFVDYNDDLRDCDAIIKKLSNTLKRRGPDASGEYISENACLIHRRLIVVDPENGKQPMIISQGDTQYIITYNGELYNTEDLRAELKQKGYTFKGHSDTEVLLTSYMGSL